MNPYQVRRVEPDVAASEAAHEKMPVTTVTATRPGPVYVRRCLHDTNYPNRQWCGETLTCHSDGGYWECSAGHRFAF